MFRVISYISYSPLTNVPFLPALPMGSERDDQHVLPEMYVILIHPTTHPARYEAPTCCEAPER